MGMQETWDSGNNNHINFMSLFPMNYPVKPGEQLVRYESPKQPYIIQVNELSVSWGPDFYRDIVSKGYTVGVDMGSDESVSVELIMPRTEVCRSCYDWNCDGNCLPISKRRFGASKPRIVRKPTIFDIIFPLENKQL